MGSRVDEQRAEERKGLWRMRQEDFLYEEEGNRTRWQGVWGLGTYQRVNGWNEIK